ncbi:MAG: hypothetical protein AAB845_02055, partial [Patescibacteria group bacterium]
GHRHFSLQDASLCRKCQPKVLAAKQLYDKEIRKNPELIKRPKPNNFTPSEELKSMWDQLKERIKHDKLYQKHIDLSMKGTIEEQNKEIKDMKGWYQGWGFGRMMPAMMDEEMMMHNR